MVINGLAAGRGMNELAVRENTGSGFPVLDAEELERLTIAWEIWADAAPTPARRIARARAHLVFLLIRYGGLRPGEAMNADARSSVDTETGLLSVSGPNARKILLPMLSMRRIRRILSLPEAADPAFTSLDPGFLRRTFYAVAISAGVASQSGGPRAIRLARGMELLSSHMSIGNVADYLGLRGPSQIAAFLGAIKKAAGHTGAVNTFAATVVSSVPGSAAVLIGLQSFSGYILRCLCPMQKFMRLEPVMGTTLRATIDSRRIMLATGNFMATAANCLPCSIESIVSGPDEASLALILGSGERLCAHMESVCLDWLSQQDGQPLYALFPGKAVELNTN